MDDRRGDDRPKKVKRTGPAAAADVSTGTTQPRFLSPTGPLTKAERDRLIRFFSILLEWDAKLRQ